MDLLAAFTDYIAKERLFARDHKLLLAVSGGLDSVVLTDLCHRCGYSFIIAHCNFQLRGAESQRDEDFVRQLGNQYHTEVAVQRFETANYATTKKVSIQVAARELRYQWFGTFINDHKAHCIGTAHHLDDNIETMLMHFFKGTGIAGMRGILPKQGNITRPLLFARKEDLLAYATGTNLQWVEDSSNASDKYTRNFVRHRIIPLIEEVYPGATANLSNNTHRFREVEALYRQAVETWKKKLLEYKGNEVHIPVEKLRKAGPLSTIIFEIITQYGFTPQQTAEVTALLDSATGKYVPSKTHRIIRNRNWLIITPQQTTAADHILIEENQQTITWPTGTLHITTVDPATVKTLDQGPDVALLDATKLTYPLLLRKWKAGDYFYPLGGMKKKKVARFLIDTKVSLAEKEQVWVLEMDKKIVWIVGRRIDQRLRITPATKKILRIECSATPTSGGA